MLACQPSPGAPTRKRLSRMAIELPNLSPAWSGSASRVAALPTLMRSLPTPPGHGVERLAGQHSRQGRAPSSGWVLSQGGAVRSQLFDAASVARAPRWRYSTAELGRAVAVAHQSVSQLFHGPAPRSPLHRLAVGLRHSRSNTSTEYSLPGATQLSQVRSISPSGQGVPCRFLPCTARAGLC